MTLDESRVALFAESLALARALVAHDGGALLPQHEGGLVVAVAGESGSGKTASATALAHELERRGRRTVVLHQDDYFLRPPRANHAHRLAHPEDVGPQEVKLALLAGHVAAFRERRPAVSAPVVDYDADRFLERTHDFTGTDVLVVEGTYVFHLPDVDVRIFLEATHEETRERRIMRARDADDPFIEEVLRAEHALIAPLAAQADLIVSPDHHARTRAGSAVPQ